jgi:DNA-binding NarL/FixJ family response regulator
MIMTTGRLFLVDDHAVVREGLKVLLDDESDLEIVGEADNGRDAIGRIGSLRPNLVVMDLSMPGLNGIEATRQIRREFLWLKIVVLSMHTHEEYIYQSLQAGAEGYVLKQSNSKELLAGIRAVLAGGSFLSPSISRTVIDGYVHRAESRGRDNSDQDQLTSRERELLQLMAEGVPNREIAKILDISVKTVESHRSNMMRKLGLSNKTELLRYAFTNGWTTLEQSQAYAKPNGGMDRLLTSTSLD